MDGCHEDTPTATAASTLLRQMRSACPPPLPPRSMLLLLLLAALLRVADAAPLPPLQTRVFNGTLIGGTVLGKVQQQLPEKKPFGNHPLPGQTGCEIIYYPSDFGSSERIKLWGGDVDSMCVTTALVKAHTMHPDPSNTPSPPKNTHTVEKCMEFCSYVAGCNAAMYKQPDCTLLAVKDAAAAAKPDSNAGFVSAVILAPQLPPHCEGLPRRACELCAVSKNPAGCAECTRRAANLLVWPWSEVSSTPNAGRGRWQEVRGAPLPGAIDTHVGCARCFNESATPSVCIECMRPGPRNSSCWACPMRRDPYGWENAPHPSVDACITCSLKFGRLWSEEC